MNVQKVLAELTEFKSVVEKELQKFKEIEFNKNDKEENFLSVELMGILSDLGFAVECTDYLNKSVAVEGIVNIKEGKFFIENFELRNGDVIEVLDDGFWYKINIMKINNEYYAEHLTTLIKENNILLGRIRLTENELLNR